MKRTMTRLLPGLLLLLLLAVWSAAPARAAESCSANGSVVFEKDSIKVTTCGLDPDPSADGGNPVIWVDVENAGDEDVCLGVAGGVVNGFTNDLFLARYFMDNGRRTMLNADSQFVIPAGGMQRFALGYNSERIPGVELKTLSEMELCFTLAEEAYAVPYYRSEPVVITTGAEAAPVDLDALGTVVLDNDMLKLVIGQQDYDNWFGPFIYIYAENRTDRYLGIFPESAEADGVKCDWLPGGLHVAPGKRCASSIQFESPIRELKGFEKLSLSLSLYKGEDEYNLNEAQERAASETVSVTYPPQVWGEYENGGLALEIQPKYNDLITVTTPTDNEKGVLFTVSETASLEAGKYEGAGWLFSIGTVDEQRLHEMLCGEMSGAQVFAKDREGRYYIWYHPTDVRYERATTEQMRQDQDQWTMLCQWAAEERDRFAQRNGLEAVQYGNTDVDISLARAAWAKDEKHTLSTTEFGPVEINGVDGTPYAEYVMRGGFEWVDAKETPDGEYVVLGFPETDMRVDFFFAPGGYVRVVNSGSETLYQALWFEEEANLAQAMQCWYYAAAEKAGLKAADHTLDAYLGTWAEKTAGRGRITISRAFAPGKVRIEARWPNSAFEETSWTMLAALDAQGGLVYNNGTRTITGYGEGGDSWVTDVVNGASGRFRLNDGGELCWHDDLSERSEDSVFILEN